MSDLKKLIEQYESENPEKKAMFNFVSSDTLVEAYTEDFMKWQLASRPTCGKEQRKFLDEIEKLEYVTLEGDELDEEEIGLLCVPKLKDELEQEIKIQEYDFPTIDLKKICDGE